MSTKDTIILIGGSLLLIGLYKFNKKLREEKNANRFKSADSQNATGPIDRILNKQTTPSGQIVTCWHGGSKYHNGPCSVNEAQNGASTHYN